MARIHDEYFEWMYELVCDEGYRCGSYRRLLMFLHNIDFRYSIPYDSNRADDGADLRYRFGSEYGYSYTTISNSIVGPCSVLEMMVALANRCEEQIMDDPDIGNRTGKWFWGMINNLGLSIMTDERFNENFVERKIDTFLDRRYSSNGSGGLFTIDNCPCDLREVEIWYQLCWYLDSIM